MKKIFFLPVLILLVLVACVAWGSWKTISALTPRAEFTLCDNGLEEVIDYQKYGVFQNEGKADYRYKITNRAALAAAAGEGVYPNTQAYKDPVYKQLLEENKLTGDQWNFVGIDDKRAAFYKWATLNGESAGVKQFYTSLALEEGGLIAQAIKGYYSVIVNYPKTVSFTYWNTPWYPSTACITNIKYLTRKYPLLGMKLAGEDINIENGFDQDPANDIFYVSAGRIIKRSPRDLLEIKDDSRLKAVKNRTGGQHVALLQYASGDWQLKVDDKPFILKAVAYAPTKIGESPDEGTLTDWTKSGFDPYKAWVDKNCNNAQDPGEECVGDFKLMKDMGANAIRIYDHEANANKDVYEDLYRRYNIMVMMGDLLGTYAVGSGVSWYRGTNYADPVQQERLKARVRKMVEAYKDEPYILMWVLGNETNYGVANSSKRFPRPFYSFVNQVAKMIKEIDPDHPVALCNGDTLYLDIFSELCPDVDILGMNSYRGWHGFGFWQDVKRLAGKPVIVTEFGAPAYWEGHLSADAEEAQAEYHRGAWGDILYNTAGYGCGNALGGVVFEWVDEWWKAYEPSLHDTHKQWPGPVKGGWFFEEWLGLTSQGDGKHSPYMRQLRKGYYAYKEMWNPDISDKLRKVWYNIVIYMCP